MRKIGNKLVLALAIIIVFTLVIPTQNTFLADENNKKTTGLNDSFSTHTVFAEQGTATWCGHCPSMSYWLAQVSGDFIYVALVDDKNSYAAQRINELGLTGFPTTFFDGGYTQVVGHQYNVNNLQNAYDQCAARTVLDINLVITAAWMGGGQIQVSAEVTNNEDETYNGHLHVYVTEIVSRWDDADGDPYKYAMLDNYAINQDLTVSAGDTETLSGTWSGPTDITINNILVMGSVFKQSTMYTTESDSTYPEPPNSDPPSTPSTPSGPSTGCVGIEYSYSTSSTEINGDNIKYGWDWDGDSVVDEWTDYYASGEIVELSHIWDSVGSYDVQVKAKDIFGEESSFSNARTVDITVGNPPEIPSSPSGETEGMHSKSYSYSTSTTDPNLGDMLYYKFNWDDFTTTDWLGPYESGESISSYHSWDEPGEYDIKVKAKDLAGSETDWSDTTTVEMGNTPPENPDRPEGPSSGIVGIEYTYSTHTNDPEYDNLEYFFDWGDATDSGWIDNPFASHTWLNPGEYGIRVKARDSWDESDWSTFKTVFFDEGSLSVEIHSDLDLVMVGEEIQFNATPIGGSEPFTYEWDFGDGNTSDLKNPVHAYETMGEYVVSVSARDRMGAFGSNYTTVNILLTHPPEEPELIEGANQTIVGEIKSFIFSAVDPDDDNIYIMVDWGDNSVDLWNGPYASGEEVIFTHAYDDPGSYEITAKTMDIHQYESQWYEAVTIDVFWNEAFLFGSHEIINETEEKTKISANSVVYMNMNPFKLRFFNEGEEIIISSDSGGILLKGFLFGKFLVGYIPD